MRNLRKADLKEKRVLLRVDLNVPVQNGEIVDLSRITQIIPTIEFLKSHKAKIILISHFGRPKGVRDEKYSLKFLQPILGDIYKSKLKFIDDLYTPNAIQTSFEINADEILLLENLRFYQGEESDDIEFARQLAAFGDIYVNDAFSCSHRKHASICAITSLIPSYPGLMLEAELENLKKSVDPKISPKIMIIAGLKVSTKFKVLESLVKTSDKLIIGGAMANTFLQALGFDMANSFVETNFVEQASQFYSINKSKIILPIDLVCDVNGNSQICDVNALPPNAKALDVGPKSIDLFIEQIQAAKMLLWNGPLGYYEDPHFAKASHALAQAIANTKGIQSIIGGGDTLAAINNLDIKSKFSYLSTSGGAFLEWLEAFDLPGLTALRVSKDKILL
jgi:phosphoglycerate kinase